LINFRDIKKNFLKVKISKILLIKIILVINLIIWIKLCNRYIIDNM